MPKITHKSELQPSCRLVYDDPPPIGTKIWLINEFGTGCAGTYYKEGRFVAWAPLPRRTEEQKTRIEELKAQGIDPTRPSTDRR